ncbi:hypothetical protein [Desulfosarcina ovata]|nr:hypothetical protein [Desulfosarcina ovata]
MFVDGHLGRGCQFDKIGSISHEKGFPVQNLINLTMGMNITKNIILNTIESVKVDELYGRGLKSRFDHNKEEQACQWIA